MFKLFKKKDKPQVPPPAQPLSGELKIEKQLYQTRCMLQKIDDRMEQIDAKVIQLNFTIRSLIQQKNRQQARSKLQELKGYQKQLENLQTKRNVLTQFQIQLENFEQDVGITQTVVEATNLAKEQTNMNDKLSDAMLDYNQMQQDQQYTQGLFDQMAQVGVDQDDIDETLKMYEQEMNAQQQPTGLQVVNTQKQQQPKQQQSQQQPPIQQKQQQKSTQDNRFQTDLNALLE